MPRRKQPQSEEEGSEGSQQYDYDPDDSQAWESPPEKMSGKVVSHQEQSSPSKDKSDQSELGGDIEEVSYTMEELEAVAIQAATDSQQTNNDKPISRGKRWMDRRRSNMLPGPRICSICGADFSDSKNPDAIKNHMRNSHQLLPRFPCKYFGCPRVFRLERDRIIHQDKHVNPPEEKNFKCPSIGCNKWYTSQASVDDHITTSHTGETATAEKIKFVCDLCGNAYSSQSTYVRHARLKHDPNLPPKIKRRKVARRVDEDEIDVIEEILGKWYICIYCKADFKSIEEFQEHFEGNHSTLLNVITVEYRCTHCADTFTSVRELWTHRMATHFKTEMETPTSPAEPTPAPPLRPVPPIRNQLRCRAPPLAEPDRPLTAYLPKNKKRFTVLVRTMSPAATVGQNLPSTSNGETTDEESQPEDDPLLELGADEEADAKAKGAELRSDSPDICHGQPEQKSEMTSATEILPPLILLKLEERVRTMLEANEVTADRGVDSPPEGDGQSHSFFQSTATTSRLNENDEGHPEVMHDDLSPEVEPGLVLVNQDSDAVPVPMSEIIQIPSTNAHAPVTAPPLSLAAEENTASEVPVSMLRSLLSDGSTPRRSADQTASAKLTPRTLPPPVRPTDPKKFLVLVQNPTPAGSKTPKMALPPCQVLPERKMPIPATQTTPKKKKYGVATITIVVPIKSKSRKDKLDAKNKELCGMIRDLVFRAMESDDKDGWNDIHNPDIVTAVHPVPLESNETETVPASSSLVHALDKEVVIHIPRIDTVEIKPESCEFFCEPSQVQETTRHSARAKRKPLRL